MTAPHVPLNLDQHRHLTGLLLGAGASYNHGMPLVWELTRELKSWLTPDKLRALNHHWREAGPGFDYPDAVIELLASMLDREDLHYENVLGFLQMQARRSSGAAQSYNGLYSFLLDIVYALLQERHLLNVEYIEHSIQYLDGIKSLVRENAPLWIFSLNHDLVIECFAAEAGIPIDAGFTEETIRLPRRATDGTPIGHLDAAVLPERVLKTQGLPFLGKGATGINLLKLHGSLDMFTFRDGRDVLKLLPNGTGVEGVLSSLRIANHELRYVDPDWPHEVTTRNEIMYSEEDGEMQFLRRSLLAGAYKFDPRQWQVIPNEMLGYFRSNLNHLTTLVCIGYSFGDRHVNEAIREWLEFTGQRRLTIVDPRASEIPGDLLHVATQVEVVASDGTDYLDQVGGITRAPLEDARRRFSAWARGKGPGADTTFREFHEEQMKHSIDKVVEWAKKMPMRDGNVDLEALRMTADELRSALIAEAAIPSPADVIESFLQQQAMRRDD